MPHYYAEFRQHGGDWFRLDTRIYLCEDEDNHERDSGQAVAAIIAKNPGSASRKSVGGKWEPLILGRDKMLPKVRNIFVKAYALAEKSIPADAYVQVLNLSYFCSEKIRVLLKFLEMRGESIRCPCSESTFPIVWFAWGGPSKPLDPLKSAYSAIQAPHKFFYDRGSKKVVSNVPRTLDFAKHPQGLPADPIIKHLSAIL